jgi:pyruvate formate lyase activating enzyme
LKILLVTNGYLTETAFEVLSGDVDAMNIDLKGFSEVFYELQCCGHLAPVLQLIQGATKVAHIELTFLAIEPLNTDLEEFQRCVDWIAGVNPDLPLHISRYFPCYTMSLPETPLSVLYDLKALAQKSLHHVYVGNVPGASAVVFCPYCQKPLADPVSRAPLTQSHMMCSACGSKLYGSI